MIRVCWKRIGDHVEMRVFVGERLAGGLVVRWDQWEDFHEGWPGAEFVAEADPQPDPWADLADDIRRTGRTAETAEVWQARATQAEARVAELEAAIVRAAGHLRDDMPRSALNVLEAANA